MDIKLAAINDAHNIAQVLILSWKYYFSSIFDKDRLNAMEQSQYEKIIGKFILSDKCSIFAAFEENQVIGYCAIQKKPQCIEIISFFVLPDYARFGIGTKLLSHVINYYIDSGIKKICLWCLIHNEIGCSFYRKMKFNSTGQIKTSSFDNMNEEIQFEKLVI